MASTAGGDMIPSALAVLRLMISSTPACNAFDASALQVFPGKSEHDAGLNPHQAENDSHMEKDNAELLLCHVIAPDQFERSLLKQVDVNLTNARAAAFIHRDLNRDAPSEQV
jgi:hypothetical protein